MPCTQAAALSLEEGTLVRFAGGGNEEALQELFSRYVLYIRAQASSIVCTGLETEDLVQEGMIGLMCAVRSYRAERGASFRTYALLCIKRRMLSVLKSASRQKHIPLNNYISLDDEANAQAVAMTRVVNPEDMIVCRESIGALHRVMNNCLTETERGIFKMYLSGMTYAAMAESCHMSIKYIDNSLQRIKKKLIISLED